MNNNIPVGDKYRMHRLYNNNPPNNKISTNRLVTQHNQYKKQLFQRAKGIYGKYITTLNNGPHTTYKYIRNPA
jgi:hypothetical protein